MDGKQDRQQGVAAPVSVTASWTAVLYVSATAALCKHQPIIVHMTQ
jgi:hypothetical protein